MMTDPLADLLTRIRNAIRNRAGHCEAPGSRLKVGVLEVLKREGFIAGYEVQSQGARSNITVELKYGPENSHVITSIERYSKPGCRRYRGFRDLPQVRGGMGICVVSTPRGILSDRECREQKVGGEVLCTVE